jgi:N-acetylglutamate synthase-like GNAT family acetyltransferase
MEARARDYGIELVYLWTEDQLEFYLKRGYEKFDQLLKPGRTLNILSKNLDRSI